MSAVDVNGETYAEIYDTNRSGSHQIMDTNWNGNGGLTVTIRQFNYPRTAKTERQARDLARRALTKVRSTRLNSVFIDEGGCLNYRFTVSRLDLRR